MFWKQTRRAGYILGAIVLLWPVVASAQSSSSTNYRVDQTFFGTGGELDASSASYRAKQTAGELGVGRTSSASYLAQAGFNTTDDPFIELSVTQDNIDLGVLDTAAASTATGTFQVRAWQAGGYSVVTASDPPSNPSGGHQLTPLSSPTASSPGTEQFGMNLVANTSPATFGAAEQQVPDATFSFGAAATGYDTANQFKYQKGNVIAGSTVNTSVTIYTISYIYNISTATPSGQYTFRHDIVAIGMY